MQTNRDILKHYIAYWREYKQQPAGGKKVGTKEQERFFIEHRMAQLREILRRHKCLSIINCGCGKGTWSVPLARDGFKVVNIDYSQDALDISQMAFQREKLQGLFIRGNLLKLPVKDNSFDCVISFGLLEHFEDLTPIMSEMTRILKPGGLFIADVITKRFSVHSIQEAINLAISVVVNLLRFRFDRIRTAIHNYLGVEFYENSYSYGIYKRKAEECGLRRVRVKGVRPFPFIILPKVADRAYARILRRLERSIGEFEESGSGFSKFWSAIWVVYGIK